MSSFDTDSIGLQQAVDSATAASARFRELWNQAKGEVSKAEGKERLAKLRLDASVDRVEHLRRALEAAKKVEDPQ